ncbi:MAG: glycosyltransferase family 4 protein [Candidatus Eisenbacteria bacterium]
MVVCSRRIAVVSENLSPPLDEGFKKASVALATALSGLGSEVTVFTPDAPGLPVPTEPLPLNKLLTGSSFSRNLRNSKPDVILYIPQSAATPMSLIRTSCLRRLGGGIPVVMLSLQRRTYSPLVRPFLRSLAPDLTLALSSGTVAILEEAGIKARRVPLGVDTGTFRPPAAGEKAALREKYGIGDGRVLLHVGHLSARRNLGLLKRTVADGWKLVIVSSTSTEQDTAIAQELKDGSIVVIGRYIENIDEIFRLADAYVFPTFAEMGAIEIPLSVLEAMATNLPVVTTGFGGIPDLFRDGKGLYICSSEAELADRTREALGVEGVSTRQLVLGLGWDKVADTVIKTIESEIA